MKKRADGGAVRVSRLAVAAASFAGYSVIMLLLERPMRRSGGAGIVAFELAGDVARANQVMTDWGYEGRRAARWSLWLDFGYMLSYGTLTALLLDRARRERGHPSLLPLLVVPAVVADAVEGVSLLNVLSGKDIGDNAHRARCAAITKFGILFALLGYLVRPRYASRGGRE